MFNLLVGKIKILLCFFFLFLVICNSFLVIPVVKENARLKIAIHFSTGATIAALK